MSPLSTDAPRRGRTVARFASACACAALLASCSGSSGGASPSSPAASLASPGNGSSTAAGASPTPAPSPRITSGPPPAGAVAVATEYWRLLSEDRFAAARALLSPASPMRARWPRADTIVRARLVRADGPVLRKTLKAGETVKFPVEVYIVPRYPVGNWDGPGTYVQYMSFVRMSDGSWRLVETGTGE